jgi:hypothetical protein
MAPSQVIATPAMGQQQLVGHEPNNKLLIKAVTQLLVVLDVVQDFRALSETEVQFKKDLKVRLLGLTVVEKLRARQASRLTSIKAAEANSKLFCLQANGRRRKNYIHSLETPFVSCHTQEDTEFLVFNHYNSHFGRPLQRNITLNWQAMGFQRHDLGHLEDEFTLEEVHSVIKDIASEKAPGPDGFIGGFFKGSWGTIRQDIMMVVHYFYQLHDQHLKHLNSAHVVLILKKADARTLADYRPISLTHSVAKILLPDWAQF